MTKAKNRAQQTGEEEKTKTTTKAKAKTRMKATTKYRPGATIVMGAIIQHAINLADIPGRFGGCKGPNLYYVVRTVPRYTDITLCRYLVGPRALGASTC